MTAPSSALVSVIVPAWNAEQWVEATVRSVLDQTWKNLELIVVDDGSSDKTADIVNAILDSRVRLIRQSNVGAAAARNTGLAESTGDYVQFLDADDILSSDKIALQIEGLANADPRSVASCAWTSFTNTISTVTLEEQPVWRISDPVDWLVRSLSGEGMMQPAGWLVPRAVAEAAGPWNETLSLHDDGEYFARVLVNSSRNVFMPGATVYYRVVPQSLSRRRNRSAAESAFAVCKSRHVTLLAARDDAASRRAIATQYAQFAYEFSGMAPDLCALALGAINEIGAQPANVIGGQAFRISAAALGFVSACKLRLLAQ